MDWDGERKAMVDFDFEVGLDAFEKDFEDFDAFVSQTILGTNGGGGYGSYWV